MYTGVWIREAHEILLPKSNLPVVAMKESSTLFFITLVVPTFLSSSLPTVLLTKVMYLNAIANRIDMTEKSASKIKQCLATHWLSSRSFYVHQSCCSLSIEENPGSGASFFVADEVMLFR